MLVNILIFTNILLNAFFSLILGIVAFSVIKQRNALKKATKELKNVK